MTAEGRFKEWLLGKPKIYNSVQFGIGKSDSVPRFVTTFIKPFPGMRVLDIGCGSANILHHLTECEYLGIDHNESYITSARATFGDRGSFKVADVSTVGLIGANFDRILLLGVLHHLTDDQIRTTALAASQLLAPMGLLIAGFDPVKHRRQHPIARLLATLDRGKYVRTSQAYQALLNESLKIVEAHIAHDYMKVPYSHSFLIATRRSR